MQHQFQYPKVTPVGGAPASGKPQDPPRPAGQGANKPR
jgi:hypothetical protein